MTDSQHGRRTATHRQRRPAGHYCAYCGRKCGDPESDTTDGAVGAPARAFCDATCERAWNIDASDAVVEP